MLFIVVMLNRTLLLKLLLKIIDSVFEPIRRTVTKLDNNILKTIDRINDQEFVFFTRGDSIATLNSVLLYITNNEHTKKLKIVTVYKAKNEIPEKLDEEIDFLDREYPQIDIEFQKIEGKFCPELIEELSVKWKIPINFMFIGSPSNKFPYRIEELGGVRLII